MVDWIHTFFNAMGIFFTCVIVLILVGVAVGRISFGHIDVSEDDEHKDVGGSNG